MTQRLIHYDMYVPYTGHYAACSTDEDFYPKTRDQAKVTCPKCKKIMRA